MRTRIGIIATVTAICLAIATPAHGMWAYWGRWTPVVRFEQRYTIDAAGATSFWSTQFNFVEQPHSGGYVGVQTDGWGLEHGQTDLAIFSLWEAVSVQPGPGASCGEFGGEGVGLSCRVPITVEVGHQYGVVVERSAVGAGKRAWSTFTAWVSNYTTGEQAQLGSITVPYVVAMTPPANFIEYFGPTRACEWRPYAAATFQAPLVHPLNGKQMRRLWHDGTSTPSCSKEIANPQRLRIKITTGTELETFGPGSTDRMP